VSTSLIFRPGVTSPVPGRDLLRWPVEAGKALPATGTQLPWWLSPRAPRQLLQTAVGVVGVAAVQVVFWKGLPLLWAVAAAYGVTR
jgi:hypothetical protein